MREIFVVYFKSGRAMNKQHISAANYIEAHNLAKEYCDTFHFKLVNVSSLVFDMRAAIDKKKEDHEGIST